MRHLNGVYTQKYNRQHECDGPLFKGRYKSILVHDDSHLLQLVRYVHKNPVKAGIVEDIKDYEFSSYKGYLSYAKKWDWLHKDHILSMISSKQKNKLRAFIEFMNEEESEEVRKLFSLKKLPSIFGPESFITDIKEKYYLKKKHPEIPESKNLSPASDAIISAVCEHYNVSFNDLLITRRGTFNAPRSIAVYLLRILRGEKLDRIGELFKIENYSTVSSIIRRVKQLKGDDRRLNKQIKEIHIKIRKTQRQT
jgi:hypothetical protein